MEKRQFYPDLVHIRTSLLTDFWSGSETRRTETSDSLLVFVSLELILTKRKIES